MNPYTSFALKKIAEGLQEMINEKGLSMEEIAIKSEVSIDKLNAILNGNDYQMSDFIKVCRVLQVHLEISLMTAKNNNFTKFGGQTPIQDN